MYIGREPLGGEVILMNSIESQFNGVLTTFNLTRTVSGVTSAFYPVGTEQLLVSLGGVIQQPDPTGNTGFRISSNTIIFAIAPVAGASCFIVAYGNLTDIGAPANNTVTTDKLVDGSVTPIKLSTGGPWWLSNGNVGIGTTDPTAKITVDVGTQTTEQVIAKFTANVSGTAGHVVNILTENSQSGASLQAYSLSTSSTAFLNSINDAVILRSSSGTANGFALLTANSTCPLIFATDSTERVRISPTGNVGIGTTNPATTLHVSGSSIISNSDAINPDSYVGSVVAGSIADGSGWGALGIGGNYGTGDSWALAHNGSSLFLGLGNGSANSSIGSSMRWDPDGSHHFMVRDSEKMTLLLSGNVGIGTTNPEYKLEVNGSFAATTKSFVIPHPSKPNYQLRYACLEGPENSVYVRGRTQTNIIELPDYWVDLVHEDSITVNLTPVGNKRIWVEEINNNKVYINSEDTIDCFYTVFAERKDVEQLIVEIEEN